MVARTLRGCSSRWDFVCKCGIVILLWVMVTMGSGDVDDLVNMTNKLGVEAEEDWDENEEAATEFGEHTLLGRIVAKREMTAKLFQSIFSRMWKMVENWKMKIVDKQRDKGVVQINFNSRIDAKVILNKPPWIFNGGMLILEEWPSTGNWKDAKLDKVYCWTRIRGFPLKSFTLTNVRRIGEMAGEVTEIRWSNTQQVMLNGYVRVRIGFPIGRSIFVGRFIPSEGNKTWIQIKFERLPILCYKCGIWGHEQVECTREEVMVVDDAGRQMPKYGNWLNEDDPTPNCIMAFDQSICHMVAGGGTDVSQLRGQREGGVTIGGENRRDTSILLEDNGVGSAGDGQTNSRKQTVHSAVSQTVMGVMQSGVENMGQSSYVDHFMGGDVLTYGKQPMKSTLGPINIEDINGIDGMGSTSKGLMDNTNSPTIGQEREDALHIGQEGEVDVWGHEAEAENDHEGGSNGGIATMAKTTLDEEKVSIKNVSTHNSLVEFKGGSGGFTKHDGEGDASSVESHDVNAEVSISKTVDLSSPKLDLKLTRLWSKAERIANTLQFGERLWTVDRVGLSGGLLLLWRDDINLRIDSSSPGHIVAEVAGKDFCPWTLTCFYGNPDASQRKFSWELLRKMRREIVGPWLCVGDFNEIVSLAEKTGGRLRASKAMEEFREVLDDCKLIDFSSIKTELTWCDGHSTDSVMERLDRGLCNEMWLHQFEGADIQLLDWWESDHRALIVDVPVRTGGDKCGQTKRRSRFHLRKHGVRKWNVEKPKKIEEFRPISLCNVIYKIVSKCMANRMQSSLGGVISDSQSAFVKGRLIHDNAIIGVEWRFLKAVMLRLGYRLEWVEKVMRCVSSVQFSFLINGEIKGFVSPQRGLRQGDPLSPFLFLFCAEAFSGLIQAAEANGMLQGIKFGRNGLMVSHLFFVDDSLVFFDATREACSYFKLILEKYSKASGQMVNFSKSEVCFGRTVQADLKMDIAELLGMKIVDNHGKYLGLPSFVGRNKKQLFDVIKNRVWNKLRGWKGSMFSMAGKEVLIKAIVQAIPTYTMSCFRLTKSTINNIHRMAARFCRVLKASYYPNGDVLHAKCGTHASFVWRSLYWGKKVILGGYRWRIGNGNCVRIMEDPWLPRPRHFKIYDKPCVPGGLYVVDLKRPNGCWDEEFVRVVFNEEDADIILKLPSTGWDIEDKIMWHYTKNGEYSVKSGYCMAMELRKEVTQSNEKDMMAWWRGMWKLKLPPKVKHFVWKMANSWLPTHSALTSRGMDVDPRCSRCSNGGRENIFHALWRCHANKDVWKRFGIQHQIKRQGSEDVLAFFMRISKAWEKETFELFLVVSWQLWYIRNNTKHGGIQPKATEVFEWCVQYLEEYRGHGPTVTTGRGRGAQRVPHTGVWKINVDAGVKRGRGWSGVSCVIQDSSGCVSYASSTILHREYQPLHAELMAIHGGLQTGIQRGVQQFYIESDCLEAIQLIQNKEESCRDIDGVLDHIRHLLSYANVKGLLFVYREANKVAHVLANYALMNKASAMWIGINPPCANLAILQDLPNPCN
uniref:CCHC-type domain-containing protein n=1 Tax=Cannabis sativa TaxID=3483 RepID=A0A803QE56_CANSA